MVVAVVDLLSPGDEGWAAFNEWLLASPRTVEVLPFVPERRQECLLGLQVSTRSALGALAWHTGGVLIDHGWLRLLGGVSAAGMPDIATASGLGQHGDAAVPPSYLVVAHDVVGGRFAVNGGALPGERGDVAYFGPDTLEWLPLGQTYSDFVAWALAGDTVSFYADLHWPDWQVEAEATSPDALLSCYPPLFTTQAQAQPSEVSRRQVPWREVVELQDEMARQLRDVPDGGEFAVAVEPAKRKRGWRR